MSIGNLSLVESTPPSMPATPGKLAVQPPSNAEEFAQNLKDRGHLKCIQVNGDPRGRNDVYLAKASAYVNITGIESDPSNREAGGKITTLHFQQDDRLQLDGILPDVLHLLFNHRLPDADNTTT